MKGIRLQETGSSDDQLLSEADLALINAIQINPRASWSRLSTVLGVSATTVARRWQHLQDAGLAWTTAALGPRLLEIIRLGFLELDCEPGRAQEAIAWLQQQPHIMTLEHVTGSHNLRALIWSPTAAALSTYLLQELPVAPGIRSVRTQLATSAFATALQWRLQALARDDAAAIVDTHAEPESHRPFDQTDKTLFTLLSHDGRAEVTTLARDLDLSPRTVQRRITRLINAGYMTIRCDLARGRAGWHSGAIFYLSVPDHDVDAIGAKLATWRETRTCVGVSGTANLTVSVGLHSAEDSHEIATRILTRFPAVRILDRRIVLRQYKLYGRLLNAHGASTGAVTINPWHLG
ncbi:Lrp/AsnC family transcriptional regulator [Amycolatopsis sp. GM8]|uniref:Lrp/AsnC family transcriptional regulator n=1 Tax=Amycolatopsis sp. GM8 TaxID=2896530 RepID=UPI001F36186F|nr:Lrp/AsnC family transcriptional regulator [Amycolatopsis sp. GM8]